MLSKSLLTATGFIVAAITLAPAAQAGGCGGGGGGYGYSSYQSRPSSGYAAKIRAERRAEARAAAARRARVAAAKAEKTRVAKAEVAAEKDAPAKTAQVKSEAATTETGSLATVTETAEDKVDVAAAPTTCSKFVAAVGASVPVACDQK